jgi:hypothetical protein
MGKAEGSPSACLDPPDGGLRGGGGQGVDRGDQEGSKATLGGWEHPPHFCMCALELGHRGE